MKKITLFISSLAITALMQAQVIHVPDEYPTIQQGIAAANPGDTVLVADGLFYEQINFLGKKPLMVASHFLIDGNVSHINNTIIDGSQLSDMDNASVVAFKSGEDTTAILYGFTVRGGKGTYVTGLNDRSGGGIYISGSGAKIMHNNITGNTVDDTQPVNGQGVYGGGIGTENDDGTYWIVIEHNRIFGNTAVTKYGWSGGGGIYTAYNARIANNDIYENTTTSMLTGWGQGGGISHIGAGVTNTLVIKNNKIHHNTAQASVGVGTDGGMGCQFAHLIFSNNEVTANSGLTPAMTGGVGGLTCVDPAEGCIISGNTFKDNISTNVGGGIHLENTTGATNPNLVLISDNYFINNEADEGGALCDIDIPLFIQNNVFNGNHSTNRGGALRLYKYGNYTFAHMDILINNTFSGNTAGYYGGAIYSNRAKPLVFNTIFYNNSAGTDGAEIYLNHFSDTLDISNCNIDMELVYGSVYNGGGNINEDPRFADPELLTLQSGSPCIENGTESYICHCGNLHLCPDLDIEGYERPQGSKVDMGAYEYLYLGVEESAVGSRQSAVACYPNPFCEFTTLEYELDYSTTVNLSIYNHLGQLVSVLAVGEKAAGRQQVSWEANGLPSGIYLYRLTTGNNRLTTGKLVRK